jgi:pullulanase/glycogen debranching enzyme
MGEAMALKLNRPERISRRSLPRNFAVFEGRSAAEAGFPRLFAFKVVCIAVLLDVVFNHIGCDHNILWEVARDSFGRGDTIWGMIPDFRHPQVRHFFNQNLLYWRQEFHVDGFRFDHTKSIIENANPSFFSIHHPSTGGGWEFLNELRQTVKQLDPQCLFMAEQLPNDWALTNYGGSMDTQWGDNFHDRTVDLCKGFKG